MMRSLTLSELQCTQAGALGMAAGLIAGRSQFPYWGSLLLGVPIDIVFNLLINPALTHSDKALSGLVCTSLGYYIGIQFPYHIEVNKS